MRTPRRFTLLELLAVMAIMLILLALSLPVLRHAKEDGRNSQCVNNLKQIGVSLQLYCDGADGRIPPNSSGQYAGSSTSMIWFAPEMKMGMAYLVEGSNIKCFGCPLHGRFTPESVADRWLARKRGLAAAYNYRETFNGFNPVYDKNAGAPAVLMDHDLANGVTGSKLRAHGGAWTNILFYDGHVRGAANNGRFTDNNLLPDEDWVMLQTGIWNAADGI